MRGDWCLCTIERGKLAPITQISPLRTEHDNCRIAMVPALQDPTSCLGDRNMTFPKFAILRPKNDCVKNNSDRVPFSPNYETVAYRRSNAVCLLGRPGGHNAHIFEMFTHIDVCS